MHPEDGRFPHYFSCFDWLAFSSLGYLSTLRSKATLPAHLPTPHVCNTVSAEGEEERTWTQKKHRTHANKGSSEYVLVACTCSRLATDIQGRQSPPRRLLPLRRKMEHLPLVHDAARRGSLWKGEGDYWAREASSPVATQSPIWGQLFATTPTSPLQPMQKTRTQRPTLGSEESIVSSLEIVAAQCRLSKVPNTRAHGRRPTACRKGLVWWSWGVSGAHFAL